MRRPYDACAHQARHDRNHSLPVRATHASPLRCMCAPGKARPEPLPPCTGDACVAPTMHVRTRQGTTGTTPSLYGRRMRRPYDACAHQARHDRNHSLPVRATHASPLRCVRTRQGTTGTTPSLYGRRMRRPYDACAHQARHGGLRCHRCASWIPCPQPVPLWAGPGPPTRGFFHGSPIRTRQTRR